VAYSGGVDSSLVAALVKRAFPTNSFACIGLSASLPSAQLTLAREVAAYIGIPLKEVTTTEGDAPEYVANRGLSCFHCKTHLYTALQTVAAEAQNYRQEINDARAITMTDTTAAAAAEAREENSDPSVVVTLFNGTNAEDRQDPTRVGLKAARDFRVRSPIDHLSKNEVRALAKALGLPNWQHAASPCLRSRLALGVPAVEEHLQKVEAAEGLVRATLGGGVSGAAGLLGVHHNVRVRLLAQGKAVIEVDEELLEMAASFLVAMEGRMKAELGFAGVTLRAFKSGSVNGLGGTTTTTKKKEKKEMVEEEVEQVVMLRSSGAGIVQSAL
jgi:PP-loop superfamily ATP-utilizing enzyme